MSQVVDILGQKFGRLTVVSFEGVDKHRKSKWKCTCECGNVTVVNGGTLRSGHTSSCGCFLSETTGNRRRKHGQSGYTKSSEYITWLDMKRRCTKPNSTRYDDYGGRGIRVCDRWMHSFENFLEDMGPKPSPSHSIDRIEVNGNYEPSNCKWATDGEQAKNKRLQYNNKTGVRGVNWHKATNKWQVRISIDSVRIEVGYYESFEDAVKARKEAELKYWKKSS